MCSLVDMSRGVVGNKLISFDFVKVKGRSLPVTQPDCFWNDTSY